ncbi:putative metal chaperone YciC [compost metagenome]
MPREQWPQDVDNSAAILKNWVAESGDCRQELVFIGQNIDFEKLSTALDACLLTDQEMELGHMGWLRLPDPFGPWHEEAAA